MVPHDTYPPGSTPSDADAAVPASPVVFRRRLHRLPELSFAEYDTAAYIERQLAAAGIPCRRIARTGVLARLEGEGDLGQAVVLRADIDALPIREEADVPWRSEHDGTMHACGHDLHAAVLYGALLRLAADRRFEGTLFGLFQPGEERNPGGASLVLAEDPFAGYNVRAVIGEHVEPTLEVGTFGFRPGKYMAANDEVRLAVRGRGGHGALRTALRDPVAAAAELVTALLRLNTPERVLSIGRIEAPGATNVIPDQVRLEGTLRVFGETERTEAEKLVARIAADNDARHGTRTEVELDRGYPCVTNDPALTAQAETLACRLGYRTKRLPLRTTAEDFGHYGMRYPSLFYRLGVGTAAGGTHTPRFNPDEGAIEPGIGFMTALARQILKK